MNAGIVFIADFIRAWAADRLSPDRRDAIAKQCGLRCGREPTQATQPLPGVLPTAIEEDNDAGGAHGPGIKVRRNIKFEDDGPPQSRSVPDRPRPSEPPRPVESVTPTASTAMRLEPIAIGSPDRAEPGIWWRNLEPMPRSPARTPALKAVAPEPLLRRAWQRAIFAEIAATFRAEGEPDMSVLVEAIARQKIPRELPRARVKSNRLGLYCYLDTGDGMGPFAADQKELIDDLQKVVGKDLLSVRRFRGSPLQTDSPGTKAVEPPPAGYPVLLLTDLGIGRPRYSTDPASVSEWMKFATILKHSGNQVVALVPYPRARWPLDLRRVMKILFWDRSTNSRVAAAAVRPNRIGTR